MSYSNCDLCKRSCGVNRNEGEIGYCRSSALPTVARASLHMWEEPIISGTRGSGTIFFSGCSLGCVYCQNSKISRGQVGKEITDERLAGIMLELERAGAHNVNFVTGTHFAPSIVRAVEIARANGLKIATVYNTGAYDSKETVRMLSGSIDIWLPDLKYYRSETAARYSSAPDLPKTSREAIDEMVRICPAPMLGNDGLMKRGVIVRVLLLPMHLAEAKLNVKYLYERYGDSIYLSLMSQYTPPPGMMAPLDRKVTSSEYRELVDYADRLGIKNAFIQEGTSASESFIPDFDLSGI